MQTSDVIRVEGERGEKVNLSHERHLEYTCGQTRRTTRSYLRVTKRVSGAADVTNSPEPDEPRRTLGEISAAGER